MYFFHTHAILFLHFPDSKRLIIKNVYTSVANLYKMRLKIFVKKVIKKKIRGALIAKLAGGGKFCKK